MSNPIYTLGTGTRNRESFFKILKNKRVDMIIDVRRFPTSKNDEFKKENLAHACMKEGIEYLYLGEELGGFRKGGYEKYMDTDEFEKGIKKLTLNAAGRRVCIICAETLPWKCHRRFIARRLIEMGYEIIHIIDEKHTWCQRVNSVRKSSFDQTQLKIELQEGESAKEVSASKPDSDLTNHPGKIAES